MEIRQILVVDDDEDDCDLFCDAVLTVDSTIECRKVFTSEGALKLLETEYKPDFIFLDINMPMLDGRWCLTELGKKDSLAEIPVVIYTTSKRAKDQEETSQLGAVHFITKPNTLAELCSEISFVLDKKWEDKFGSNE